MWVAGFWFQWFLRADTGYHVIYTELFFIYGNCSSQRLAGEPLYATSKNLSYPILWICDDSWLSRGGKSRSGEAGPAPTYELLRAPTAHAQRHNIVSIFQTGKVQQEFQVHSQLVWWTLPPGVCVWCSMLGDICAGSTLLCNCKHKLEHIFLLCATSITYKQVFLWELYCLQMQHVVKTFNLPDMLS